MPEMSDTPKLIDPTPSQSEHSHHRRKRKPENRLKSFFRKYSFEILWVVIIAAGVFLLFEQLNIRPTLRRWLEAAIGGGERGAGTLRVDLARFLSRLSLSDKVGLILVILALLAMALRMRWRLMHTASLTKLACPRCGSTMHRSHRHLLDRVISAYVPVRRYRCSSKTCRWHGLRVYSGSHAGPPAPSQAED